MYSISKGYIPGFGDLDVGYSRGGAYSPSGNAATVRDEDLQYASSGTLQASATHIRKRP